MTDFPSPATEPFSYGWQLNMINGQNLGTLYIGHLPGRKQVSLYHTSGENEVRTLAFFRNEEDAELAYAFIERMFAIAGDSSRV